MSEKTNHIEKLTTITGFPLAIAMSELDRKLDNRAYKPIRGGKGETLGLTDLDPTYMYELVTELFGPLGVGWAYTLDRLDSEVVVVEGRDRQRTDYVASCCVSVRYAYREEGTEMTLWSAPMSAPGGSSNSQPEWAAKGAVTNALGTAWYFAGYQHSVYKGIRSHKNVAQEKTRPANDLGRPFTDEDPEAEAKNRLSDMEKAKDLVSLRRIYANLRGSASKPSALWSRISPELQGKIEKTKEELKKTLSNGSGQG